MKVLVFLAHASGEFIARVEVADGESAVDKVMDWATARHLDVDEAWLADEGDLAAAEGQIVEVN
jgi:hypothetical protein